MLKPKGKIFHSKYGRKYSQEEIEEIRNRVVAGAESVKYKYDMSSVDGGKKTKLGVAKAMSYTITYDI